MPELPRKETSEEMGAVSGFSTEALSEEALEYLRLADPYPEVRVENLTSFSEGDVVDYGEGLGVVVGKMTESFEWANGETVEASSDNTAYIVAKESGGSDVYRASDLSTHDGSISEDEPDPKKLASEAKTAAVYDRMGDPFDEAELANVPGVDDPETGFSSLPDGWTRATVLEAWASLGGTFTSCRADMQGEIRSPKRFCAAMKDEVLQTEEWRGKF